MACPNIAAPCVLLKPPLKDLASPVLAVEAMTTVRAAIGSETSEGEQAKERKVAATAASEGQLAFWSDARVGALSTTSYSEQVHFLGG